MWFTNALHLFGAAAAPTFLLFVLLPSPCVETDCTESPNVAWAATPEYHTHRPDGSACNLPFSWLAWCALTFHDRCCDPIEVTNVSVVLMPQHTEGREGIKSAGHSWPVQVMVH